MLGLRECLLLLNKVERDDSHGRGNRVFIGMAVGFLIGILLTVLVRLPFANWTKFIESAGIGFGIGVAFFILGALFNLLVKFADKQSQKVKGGAAE